MLKSDLRLFYSKLRSQIPSDKISDFSLLISNKILDFPIWDFDYYHIFLPIPNKKEVETEFLLSILQGRDKHIVIPKMEGDTLTHFLLTDNTKIRPNRWNVPEPVDGIKIEPSKIDVVFMPLLAYDKKGNRVGYGKGYYDRFLQQCRPDVIKVGLSLFEAEERIDDIFENDIPLDYCVTPLKTYTFPMS
ncbi:MAG: 5-formyltetrahydrofolate cyclo-ligase [Maribacter sp.]|nr:MAG: 5-formyltetrahydrofolate cyclo-ligase [Maribacter sp.]